MTLDLTRPEHRSALRWACALVRDCPAASKRSTHFRPEGDTPYRWAVDALHSPTESAAIVRALLEGCGVSGCSTFEYRVEFRHGNDMAFIDLADGPTFDRCAAWVPALVLRLLACATREEALAALREVGR